MVFSTPVIMTLFTVVIMASVLTPALAESEVIALRVTDDSMKKCLQSLRPKAEDMPTSGNYSGTASPDTADRYVDRAAYSGVIMRPGETLGAATFLFGNTCFAFRRYNGGSGDFCQMSFRSGRADPELIRCPANGDYSIGCRFWGAGGVAATNTGSTDIQYWLDDGPANG